MISVIVTIICLLLVYLADKFGDSSKKTAWMFFLGPIGVFTLTIYWLFIFLGFLYEYIW
jgi:apolipoprotein N-acyltransferase